ncbi:hypothetical protein M408DRAFT_47969, partial [Serendipita vermifera MAFF 305830]
MPTPFDAPVTGTPRFPVIDTDPHAVRVVRYFRTKDYTTWGAVTAGFPATIYLWARIDPLPNMPRPAMRKLYGMAAAVGAVGGFLMAYQDSSSEWSENVFDRLDLTK